MEGLRQREHYPCVIIRPFLRTPQNTQSREPPSCVVEQHEGLVAIQKVGGMTFIRELEHPCFV